MKWSRLFNISILSVLIAVTFGCTGSQNRDEEEDSRESKKVEKIRVRPPVDLTGYATQPGQMDSIVARVERFKPGYTPAMAAKWKTVVAPHDDYAYAKHLYPAVLRGINTQTVVIFGVAHKAAEFGIENQLVFDSFNRWKAPYGDVKISPLRSYLINHLPEYARIVDDSLQMSEHSVEALVPWLQYYHRGLEIVPVLVPAMSYDTMLVRARQMAKALAQYAVEKNLSWGDDFALVISSDAVHYGDEGWGGKNLAPFGADMDGFVKALKKERKIVDMLKGRLVEENIREFYAITLNPEDYHEYQWTWCGRYSIPVGLLTSLRLKEELVVQDLEGTFTGYNTSIDGDPLQVEDLGMGVTAPANYHHWVGYFTMGWR
ncbi:MAG: AmmeMemoRadiSam system protein B [Bacteroidales bacterium]